MPNLTQIITKEIEENFHHEFLSCKANLVVEIIDKNVKIIDLIDNTDTACKKYIDRCGDEYHGDEEDDDYDSSLDEYISQEEENQEQFFDAANDFVYDVLKTHLGKLEADKYTISF